MSDESRDAIWARILITVLPTPLHPEARSVELDIEICELSDPQDAIKAWSLELHTESQAPEAHGEPSKKNCAGFDRQKAYYHEVVFGAAAVLTHVKTKCETLKGGQFHQAVRMPEFIAIMPGDRAMIETSVYKAPGAHQVPEPTVLIFEEPPPSPPPSQQLSGTHSQFRPRFLGQVKLRRL